MPKRTGQTNQKQYNISKLVYASCTSKAKLLLEKNILEKLRELPFTPVRVILIIAFGYYLLSQNNVQLLILRLGVWYSFFN